MIYYLIGFVVAVAIFVTGFFVGKKHGIRVEQAAATIKGTVGRL